MKIIKGRWYWWGNSLYRITDVESGSFEDLLGVTGQATASDYREVLAEDLDDYQDAMLLNPRDTRSARIAVGLDRVREDNGLPLYVDRRLTDAISRLGAEYQPPPGWQDRVHARIRPGILRRICQRLFG